MSSSKSGHSLEPGDDRPLQPFRYRDALTHTRFSLTLHGETDHQVIYTVEVDYFDSEMKADLYRNGHHHARATTPATFPVDGGVIEVELSTYGLKRMHYVTRTGEEHVLSPDSRSSEGLRARLAQRAPRVSRAIGVSAVVILLCLLPVGLFQVADVITHTDIVSRFITPFTSPISLPGWANTTAGILAVLAGLERALTLRNHWLIDLETEW
jgi:hypothetical protein